MLMSCVTYKNRFTCVQQVSIHQNVIFLDMLTMMKGLLVYNIREFQVINVAEVVTRLVRTDKVLI